MCQKGNQIPPVPRPEDLQFVLPRQYCVTAENDQFLRVNNYANGSWMVVFGSQVAIDYLRSCDHWYMDGTLGTLPPQFLQLCTINGIKNGRNVIGLYSFLKRQATYEQFFQHVRYLVGVDPKSINLDYEITAINACQLMFSQANLSVCFFHLCQNTYLQESSSKQLAKYIQRSQRRYFPCQHLNDLCFGVCST